MRVIAAVSWLFFIVWLPVGRASEYPKCGDIPKVGPPSYFAPTPAQPEDPEPCPGGRCACSTKETSFPGKNSECVPAQCATKTAKLVYNECVVNAAAGMDHTCNLVERKVDEVSCGEGGPNCPLRREITFNTVVDGCTPCVDEQSRPNCRPGKVEEKKEMLTCVSTPEKEGWKLSGSGCAPIETGGCFGMCELVRTSGPGCDNREALKSDCAQANN